MQLSELQKEILQTLYEQYQEVAPQEEPGDPDCFVIDAMLGAAVDDPTEEEKKAYQDLVDKNLLNSFDFEPDEENPHRYILSLGESMLKQYPDILEGREPIDYEAAVKALNLNVKGEE